MGMDTFWGFKWSNSRRSEYFNGSKGREEDLKMQDESKILIILYLKKMVTHSKLSGSTGFPCLRSSTTFFGNI